MSSPAQHDEILPVLELAEMAHLKPTGNSEPTVTVPKTATDIDPFLVAFEEPGDADNPLNWPTGRKWMVTDVLSATGFNRIVVSTIMAPALTTITKELNMNPTEAAMSMSIYLLATAFGPLLIGPISEICGRRVVLHGSNIWFLIWNIVCGFATTKGTLIAARFFAGFGASAIYALAGGVLGDVWRPEQRGKSLGMYLLIPLLGAATGPIIGGFMAQRTTWRWMFWSTSIFQAVMIFVSMFSFPETYGPYILRRRARRIRKETNDNRYYTASERIDSQRSSISTISNALTRPVRLLMFHPIIQINALLSGFDYGILYVTLSTFSELWTKQYNHSVEISGLHYIAISLGEIIGSQIGGPLMDRLYKRGFTTPESRIPIIWPGIAVGWSGMLIYGWTADKRVFWPVVDLGAVIMMSGMQFSGLPMMAYMIDIYGEHTSSATAAVQFAKSLMAFLFPLFAPSMYSALGYGWGNTVIALTGVVLTVPLPIIILRYGARLRAKASSTY